MIPASAIIPIIDVAVNCAPSSAWPGITPMIVSGIGRHDDERRQVRPELRDDEQVDQHQADRVRQSHVAERLVRDLPLAVPLDAVAAVRIVGLADEVLGQRAAARASAAPRIAVRIANIP